MIAQFAALVSTAAMLSALQIQMAEAGDVSSEQLVNAQSNASEWLMYGRNYLNQRFIPLTGITKNNVASLKPIFAFSTGGRFGGLEATPLFHDGTLYFTADYSRVFAMDARTGVLKWRWEPKYDEGLDTVLCCGPVNRGLAMWGDKVFVATLDAHLVALKVSDGTVAWSEKLDDWKKGYSSTGAPLVVRDKVIVGVSGGEYGIRGHIRADGGQRFSGTNCRRTNSSRPFSVAAGRCPHSVSG